MSPIHNSPSLVQTLNLGPVEDEGLDNFMLALGDGLVDGAAPEVVSLSDQTNRFFGILMPHDVFKIGRSKLLTWSKRDKKI